MVSGLRQFGAPVQDAPHADANAGALAHRAAPASTSTVTTNRRARTGLAHTACVSACARNAVVTFVERISPNAVSITWRDSTGGNYREQRWVLRAARSRGVCALTGATISRGDFIYHPVGNSRVQPANLAQMIRAEALEQLE